MNHIDTLIHRATANQRARARAIAPGFARASGLQAHTCPDGYTLALANIVDCDARPVPATATRPASLDGYVPCYTVPLQANGFPRLADLRALLAWAQAWPDTVHSVRLIAPRVNEDTTVPRKSLIAGILAELA